MALPVIIDTHCHIDGKQYDNDREQVIENARAHGMTAIINIGVGLESNLSSFQLSQQYPGFLYNTVGAHPEDVDNITDEDLERIAEQAEEFSPVAIGEIGLDYHYSSDRDRQWKVLERMIELAREYDRPIVIHNREADDDMVSILSEHAPTCPKIILHSYLSGPDYVDKFLECGCYFGIGGPLTFKSGQAHRDAVKLIPLENIMLETDAPWLTPHPHRGSRNEPAYVTYIAKAIAELQQIDVAQVCEQTSNTAKSFFNLKS